MQLLPAASNDAVRRTAPDSLVVAAVIADGLALAFSYVFLGSFVIGGFARQTFWWLAIPALVGLIVLTATLWRLAIAARPLLNWMARAQRFWQPLTATAFLGMTFTLVLAAVGVVITTIFMSS